jgi:hypothetical protein
MVMRINGAATSRAIAATDLSKNGFMTDVYTMLVIY